MVEEKREFKYVDPNLISCTQPCNGELAVPVNDDKIKQLGGISSSIRCIAAGSFTRGHRFGPTEEAHRAALRTCRVCTVYTETKPPTTPAASSVDNPPPQA